MSLKIEAVVKILWDFYDYFHGSDKDYLLIILYVPTVIVGVIANIFVITMICKYHLKRYVVSHVCGDFHSECSNYKLSND